MKLSITTTTIEITTSIETMIVILKTTKDEIVENFDFDEIAKVIMNLD